ncbi:MAG TPA: hypothetical protein PKG63_02085 [Bacteroidales bacterium]|nr:hypothetical protein [Bacteroidales bacterium]
MYKRVITNAKKTDDTQADPSQNQKCRFFAPDFLGTMTPFRRKTYLNRQKI